MKKLILALGLLLPVSSFAAYQVLQDEDGNTVSVTGNALNVSGNFDVNGSTLSVNVIGTVPVSGPLTDTELRATPVPVSGTVSVSEPVSVDDNGGSLTVDGSVSVSNFPTVQPVDDNGGSLTVDGSVTAVPEKNATATVTSVSVSPTVATLASANSARIKLIIHNVTGTLYVKLGTGASSSDFSYRLTANDRVEIEQYTGAVTGTKGSGTSAALVTEY